jgi:hypothetical protein
VVDAPAKKVGKRNFTFSALGLDTQLFTHPSTQDRFVNPSRQTDLPTPISRLNLKNHLTDYYANLGDDKSIKVKVNKKVWPSERISVCDLTDWKNCPESEKIALDPKLGRITFSSDIDPNEYRDVHVSYYYGFSSEVGGGFYAKPRSEVTCENGQLLNDEIEIKVYDIPKDYQSIQDAYTQWESDDYPNAIFYITDSEVYAEPIDLALPPGSNLEIRSDQNMPQRPIISSSTVNITRRSASSNDSRANLTINGLVFDKSQLNVKDGDLGKLTLNHCTFVPYNNGTSLVVAAANDGLVLSISRCIIGSIDCPTINDSQSECIIRVSDSIVDGTNNDSALNCYELGLLENSTVFGSVGAIIANLITNSIVTDKMTVKRRQIGCARFSYIASGSRVPRRYHCQPDLAQKYASLKQTSIKPEIRPRFTSKKYGEPGYAQLYKDSPPEVFEGADNGNEMGVFNHLMQATRMNNLRSALVEYTRFGIEAGVFSVT